MGRKLTPILCIVGLTVFAACAPIPVEVRHEGSVDVYHHGVSSAAETGSLPLEETQADPEATEEQPKEKGEPGDPFAKLAPGVLAGKPNPSACNKGLNPGILTGGNC